MITIKVACVELNILSEAQNQPIPKFVEQLPHAGDVIKFAGKKVSLSPLMFFSLVIN